MTVILKGNNYDFVQLMFADVFDMIDRNTGGVVYEGICYYLILIIGVLCP